MMAAPPLVTCGRSRLLHSHSGPAHGTVYLRLDGHSIYGDSRVHRYHGPPAAFAGSVEPISGCVSRSGSRGGRNPTGHRVSAS